MIRTLSAYIFECCSIVLASLRWKDVLHALLAVLCVIVIGYSFLFGVSLIPREPMEEHVASAAAAGEFPEHHPKFLKFRSIDMSTECVGIGVALNLNPTLGSVLRAEHFGSCPGLSFAAEHGFEAPKSGYPRYVHGYTVFLKPLYTLFSLPDVRLLVGLTGLSLLALLFVAARWRLGDVYALALTGSFLLSGTLHVFTLVTHGVQFWLVLIGGILALLARAKPHVTMFACLGATDAMVSFLNMGSLSLSFPLLCYCLACWSDGVPARRILAWAFLAACAWSVGFVLPWLCKWLLALLYIPNVDLLGKTLEIYPARTPYMIWKAFFNNVKATMWQVWLGLALMLGWRFYRHKAVVPEGLWILLFPALMPLVWMCLLPGQSGIKHSSFVSIILWPLTAATCLLLLAAPRHARTFSVTTRDRAHE
jgi:hypothetical protein